MTVSKKKSFLVIGVFCLFIESLMALDFSVRLSPFVMLPFGSETTELFSVGGGAVVNAEIDQWSILSAGPEFAFALSTLDGPSSTVQFYFGGLSLSAFYYPVSRLSLRAGASFGVYQSVWEDVSQGDLYWRTYAETGFRFSPAFSLSAMGGYIDFMSSSGSSLYTGLQLGLSARYAIDTTPSLGSISGTLEQLDPVFPLFFGMYRENSIGTLRIVNNESAEIRNVRVSFSAGNYTSSQMHCADVDFLGKRKSIDVPLFADFSLLIQNFTENGKMQGEILITYDLLGSPRSSTVTVPIDVFNRNSMRWTDFAALSSFISPNSPEVLDLSKYLVGIARDKLRTGLNRNLQFAAYLYEGLRAGGLTVSNDRTTPYTEYHLDPDRIDYVQYPFQTLAYGSGDMDDIGLLLAGMFESVGIKAALIPLPDDFIVAFSLAISAEEAAAFFNSSESFMEMEGEVWIPLSMAVFREGFVNSWYNAMTQLAPVLSGEESAEVIILRDSWQIYQPSAITGKEAQFQKPVEDAVIRAAETAMLRYITVEFGPRIKALQERIRVEGGSTALYNDLGLLYIRAGMYREAKAEYRRSAGLGSVSAMVNLGNLFMLDRNYKEALDWFGKALQVQPDSAPARAGYDKAKMELQD